MMNNFELHDRAQELCGQSTSYSLARRLLEAEERLAEIESERLNINPVARVVRNEAGQISIKDGQGEYFNISKHVGDSFYTNPMVAAKITDGDILEIARKTSTVNTVKGSAVGFFETFDFNQWHLIEFTREILAKAGANK